MSFISTQDLLDLETSYLANSTKLNLFLEAQILTPRFEKFSNSKV